MIMYQLMQYVATLLVAMTTYKLFRIALKSRNFSDSIMVISLSSDSRELNSFPSSLTTHTLPHLASTFFRTAVPVSLWKRDRSETAMSGKGLMQQKRSRRYNYCHSNCRNISKVLSSYLRSASHGSCMRTMCLSYMYTRNLYNSNPNYWIKLSSL